MKVAQSIDTLNVDMGQMSVAQAIDAFNVETSTDQALRISAVIPADGATGVDTSAGVLFDWSDSEGEGVYTLVASYNEDLSSPVINRVVEGTEYQYGSALTQKVYWKLFEQTVTDRPAIVPPVGEGIGEGSRALDEQALNDLWAATQGNDIPPERVLQNESELPPINEGNCEKYINDQEFYVINGDIYKANDGPHVWLNVGPIWKDSTGWNNGNVSLQLSNYDTIAGVKVEELTIGGVTELRVTGIDFQKLNYTSNENVTAGNNLVGTLPETMGNLRQLRDRLNLKQNLLHGDIPHSMYTYPYLERWSMAGQCAEIDMDQIGETFSSNHSRDYGVPESQSIIGGKRYQHSNRFSGTIPATVNQMQSLKLFECRRQRLRGNCPDELLQIPSLRGIFIMNQRGTSATDIPIDQQTFGGPFPQDWSQMNSLQWCYIDQGESTGRGWSGTLPESFNNLPSITHSNVSRFISGDHPTFPNASNVRYYRHGAGFNGGVFPSNLFRPENNRLSTFFVAASGMEGEIPAINPDIISDNEFSLATLEILSNNLTGVIPEWIRRFPSMVISHFGYNDFTGEPPWELQSRITRIMKFEVNRFTGPIKTRLFSEGRFSAEVTEVVSPNQLRIPWDNNSFTGTVTESSSEWIRNINASHPEEWGGIAEVTVIIPEGENLVFTAVMFADNTTYIWSPSGVDTSNLAGYDYEVVIPTVNEVVGFVDPNDPDYYDTARFITARNGDVYTFDRDVEGVVSVGDTAELNTESDLLWLHMFNNEMYGKIPEHLAYIPSDRSGASFHLQNNNFGWDANENNIDFVIPDFTNFGKYKGGSCSLDFTQNRLLPYHILPNHSKNVTLSANYHRNQKKFSPSTNYSEDVSGSVIIDLSFISSFIYTGDQLEWRKDGVAVDDSDSRITITPFTIEINGLTEADSDNYNLVITNPALPGEEFVSGDQALTVIDANPI